MKKVLTNFNTLLLAILLTNTHYAIAQTETKTVNINLGSFFKKKSPDSEASKTSQVTNSESKPIDGRVKIEGGFGWKFGDVLDISTNQLISGSEYNLDTWEFSYEISPINKVAPFTRYRCYITPKTHRMVTIEALAKPEELDADSGQVLALALVKKYGPNDGNDGGNFWIPGSQILYRRVDGTRSILLTQSAEGLELSYSDDSLREMAHTETTSIKQDEKAKKQRELENKAQAVDNSAL